MRRARGAARPSAAALAWRGAAIAILEPLVDAWLRHGLAPSEMLEVLQLVLQQARRARRVGSRREGADAALAEESLPFTYAMGTRLVARWMARAPGDEPEAAPSLPLDGPDSFASLARAAGSEPTIARRALERLGLLRVTAGRATLLADAYVPSRGMIEKLDIVGRDGAEFLRTMLHNVSAASPRARLQRKASYDNIGSAALPALESVLRQLGADALMAANERLAAVDRDRDPTAPAGRRTRVSFGVYLAVEPVRRGPRSARRSGRRQGKRRV